MTEKTEVKTKETNKYFNGVGRRKNAIARIRFIPKGTGQITINGKKITEYFPEVLMQEKVNAPLKLTGWEAKSDVTVVVNGGGKTGQAEAIRLGIARALQFFDPELRKTLKVAGFLMRDARIKERKKPGLLRARRAPQWAKR